MGTMKELREQYMMAESLVWSFLIDKMAEYGAIRFSDAFVLRAITKKTYFAVAEIKVEKDGAFKLCGYDGEYGSSTRKDSSIVIDSDGSDFSVDELLCIAAYIEEWEESECPCDDLPYEGASNRESLIRKYYGLEL